MATFTVPQLTKNFRDTFEITDVHNSFTGGQKQVFIVTKKSEKCALKIFMNYGKREIRELNIYKEFEYIADIPKILSIENYEGDKIVFETFIQGENLKDIFKTYKGNNDKVTKLISHVCNTLKPFWERNPSIIHRDIKPSNIIVRPNCIPVVIDFGIARDLGEKSITDTGQPQPGSWRFATPEQYAGKKELVSYRTDFFSLGVLAYYLFYNKLPFGDTKEAIAEKYNKKDLSYDTVEECKLTSFFNETLKVLPAERPRTPDILISLLQ